MPFDNPGIVPIRDKADILAVGLCRVHEAALLGAGAHLGLVHAAEREHDVRKLLLRHGIEHVALILALVRSLLQQKDAVLLLNARVVPGHDVVAAKNFRAVKELAELHEAVAVDAGVRRDAVLVAVDEPAYDRAAEIVREVEHVERHAQRVGDAARVLLVVKRAAGARALDARVLIVIELHRAADALEAAILHQLCRERGVDPAAHRDQCFFHWRDL